MPALISILSGAAVALAAAWGLGKLATRQLAAPPVIAFAVGAALESLLVFTLLLAGAGHWAVYLALALPAVFFVPHGGRTSVRAGLQPRFLPFLLFLPYAVYYLVNALAPEITPDGAGYHLGLVAEYVRLGGFPDRIDFYGMAPQGMEMLYTVAFAFGRHSAARLVHFAFLLATVPLILRLGGKLELPRHASLAAAALYFFAPVAGITGTSAYTDAAQVFFTLAALDLLLEWRATGARACLFFAGLLAGFCYAIKFTGLVTPALVVLFVLGAKRDWRGAALAAAGAAIAIAPWMLRSLALTGNPVAPLLNAVFPNPYFHIATERELGASLRSLGTVKWWQVPWQLCVGGLLAGIAGPAFLAAPAGLLALRTRAGRWCWAAAALLALPWFFNTGARFLMPALPLVALAMALALPRAWLWTCVLLQALLCWPAAIDLWEPFHLFRLRDFPLTAALRLEPEDDYVWRVLDECKVARMVERNTPAEARVLALTSVASAYLTRDVRVYWQSAEAETLLDTLRVAGEYVSQPFYDVSGAWPEQPLTGIRVRLRVTHAAEWCIHELHFRRGEDQVHPSPQWGLRAWPNPWEVPLALDANLATRWRTWEPMRAGMYVEVDFDHTQVLDGLTLLSHTPVFGVPMECYGRLADGQWRALGLLQAKERPHQDLRYSAMEAVRKAGYGYILTPVGWQGAGPLGKTMAAHEAEWGLVTAARAGNVTLFRVR